MFQFISGDGMGAVVGPGAGTVFTQVFGGLGNFYTNLTNLYYNPGANTHTVTIMRPQAVLKAAAALAAGGTILFLTTTITDKQFAAPAVGTYVAIRLSDTTWFVTTISAYDATGAVNAGGPNITLAAAIPANKSVYQGAPVAYFGAQADAYHANYTFTATGSSTLQIPQVQVNVDMSLVRNSYRTLPMLFYSNNVTSNGTINNMEWAYSKT